MYIEFKDMPEKSRVWVYQAGRQFSPEETSVISSKLSAFCEGWNVHGNPLPTSFEILDNQIIIMAVDETGLGASGCSIDSSVRTLRQLEEQLGNDLTNQGKVTFRSNSGEIHVTSALGIKSKVISGEIDSDTFVINPQIQTKKELEKVWISASESWMSRYFPN